MEAGGKCGSAFPFGDAVNDEHHVVLLAAACNRRHGHQAREARINVIFAGHYATETVGLKALARHLRPRFGVAGRFLSVPTGY